MWLKFIRAYVIVTGEVTGVNFRYFTKEKAKTLGVNGWIRNLPEGQVEAVFEGLEDKVREMVEWCKKGPLLAKVNHVRVEFRDYKQEFDGFERR
jgi:acylphosphatase